MRMNRRSILKGALAAGVAAPAFKLPASAQTGPIKVGFLTIKTGPLASGGLQMEQGLVTFFKQRDNKLAGRPVELHTADTGGNPAQARTKTQELVERLNVHVLIGPLAAFEALAIDDYIRSSKTPILTVAGAEDMTQRKANPWLVRPSCTSAQPSHPVGEYAAKELKYKRVATIGDDFAFGHESVAGFQRVFEDNGGKVVQKLWTPLNAPDYGTYISQLKPDLDAVFTAHAGSNGLKFVRQLAEYGRKIPILGGFTPIDESLLQQIGENGLGAITGCWYSAELDNAINKKFVEDIQREYKVDPGVYAAETYLCGEVLEHAVKSIGGKVEDKEGLNKALHEAKVPDTLRGPVSFDEFGNVVGNIYLRKVEKKGGKFVNAVLKTYPSVTQFWTYNKDEFLKNPVYSRDWPPAKNLE
jgi:branched-chain amino acid transport system substrate-binding protein